METVDLIPTMGDTEEVEAKLADIYDEFLSAQSLLGQQLVQNQNQVAGHAGFYRLKDLSGLCLKPFNIECVRGRREHLFYQIVEYFKRIDVTSPSETYQSSKQRLFYENFKLFTHPSNKCKCLIDLNVIKSLCPFIAKFHHVKHFQGGGDEDDDIARVSDMQTYDQAKFKELVYSGVTSCPCYGPNPQLKSSCSKDYAKVNFLCLEDLTAHCRRPCILDIKIGQITYDPMAVKEKVVEQSTKYKRLREFGFRILGMKLGEEFKDKSFGKALETGEQVVQALDIFLNPLRLNQHKSLIIGKILERLEGLLYWFEHTNLGQLKFFSSSLLIVYDSYLDNPEGMSTDGDIDNLLVDGVRVFMIDFAHVFHVHKTNKSNRDDSLIHELDKDENYIYGLKKLIYFYNNLKTRLQHLHLPLE